MKQERRIFQGIFFQVLLALLISCVAYIYPESRFYHPGSWIFAYIFTYATVYDVYTILKHRRLSDNNLIYQGRLYWVIFGVPVLWSIGIHLLGINHFLLLKYDPLIIFSIHIGVIGIPLFSSWWLIRRLKNPFPYFAIFLSAIQLSLLGLVLATTIEAFGTNIALLELALKYPLDYMRINLYTFIGLILIFIYITKIGRTIWGATLSLIIGFLEIILQWSIAIEYGYKIDTFGRWLFLPSLFLGVLALIPQSYWADHYRKTLKHM